MKHALYFYIVTNISIYLSTYLPTYLGHDVSSRTLSVPWVCFAASQQDMLEDPHLGDLRKIFY